MDADNRKRDGRLFTIKDVAADMRVSERTLRDVIADLGFRRPPGRKRYLFDAAQVKAIKEAVQCRSTLPPEYGTGSGTLPSVAALTGRSARLELARETRRVMNQVRARRRPTD